MRAQTGPNGRIASFLAPPRLRDERDRIVAATVHVLGLSFAALAVLAAGVTAWIHSFPPKGLAVCVLMFVLDVVAVGLVHRGRVTAGAVVLVGMLGAGGILGAALSGTVASAPLGLNILAVIAAGLLLGDRAAAGTAALSALAGSALAVLEQQGALPPGNPHPGFSYAVGLVLLAATTALVVDATRRLRHAVSRARESEAFSRDLVDRASDAIVRLDSEGRIVEANDQASALTGYDRAELMRLGTQELIDPVEWARMREELRGLAPGEAGVTEHWVQRKDGARIAVESSASPLADGHYQAIVRDVSERRRAEEMQERLRTALEQAGEGIALFDRSDRLVYANRTFSELGGVSVPIVPNMRVEQLAADEIGHRRLTAARAALAEEGLWQHRFEVSLPDGSRAVRALRVALVRDGSGRVEGYVCVLRDVTREFDLEESLHRARKLEALGRLAGGVAHDFSNLLTVILEDVEQLRGASGPATAHQRAVEEIGTAASRAAALTRELLTFSRSQLVRRQAVDLHDALREAAGMLRRLMRENVLLEIVEGSGPAIVAGDPNQIQQLLLNLALNARDALPDGGRITISTRRRRFERAQTLQGISLEPGDYVELMVEDDGVGMDELVREHAFEPFFTTKPAGQGTGLGLASVQAIVEQSGGTIEVESAPDRGTRIRITLPRGEGAPAAAVPPDREPVRREPGGRVLVVEDEEAVRRLVCAGLREAGYEVVEARNGGEAVDAGATGPFDLLVTDVVLPGLGGAAVAARLREIWPGLRVLYTSGYPRNELGSGEIKEAGSDFLPKPFTVRELERKIGQLLDGEPMLQPDGGGTSGSTTR